MCSLIRELAGTSVVTKLHYVCHKAGLSKHKNVRLPTVTFWDCAAKRMRAAGQTRRSGPRKPSLSFDRGQGFAGWRLGRCQPRSKVGREFDMTRRIASSEITPRDVYLRRREFIGGAIASLALAGTPLADAAPLSFGKSAFSTDEAKTSKADVTSYNNFYEFGTGKDDPAEICRLPQDQPLDGEVRWRREACSVHIWRIPQAGYRSRSASTACAASRAGRWSSRGSAFRSGIS